MSILAASAIIGYYKGVLRIVYSLVAWVLVLVFVSWATPHINRYLLENTVIYEKVTARCEETIRHSASEQMAEGQLDMQQEYAEESERQLSNLELFVPNSVIEGIIDKTSDATENFMEESGIYTKMAEGMANFVIEGIAFCVALVFSWILVHIISQLLGIASHIPIIKGVNRLLGLFVGAVYGLLLVWLGFYVVALGSAGEMGQVVISYINENEFLTFLYENNLVLSFILKYF